MSKEYGKPAVKWIDCRLTFQKPSELERFRLVVFDNVPNKRHPMLEWLQTIEFDAITIITTTDKDVAEVACSKTANFNNAAVIVKLNPFNDIEVDSFLERTLPRSKLITAMDIAPKLGGLPLALQLLKDILIANNDNFLPNKLKNFNGELVTLLCLWLNLDDKGDLEKVLKTLCSVPLVGMDREALAHVLQSNSNNIESCIKTLREVGLISEASFTGQSTHLDNLLIAHEIVRKNFSDDEVTVLSTKRRLYQELLGSRLNKTTNSGQGVLTCIDAWLSAWDDVFDLSKGMDDTRYKTLEEHLGKLTKSGSCWETAIECVPEYVIDRFHNLDEENCPIVIGVAHMVYKLPKSKQLAKVILTGASNHDSWARGASLSAAAEQWSKLGEREEGKRELKQWLKLAYENFEREQGNPSGHWSDSLDFDFLAAITGIIKLGNINDALEIVQTKDFLNRFSNTTLTHLALIVLLAKNGALSGQKSKQSHNLICDWTASVNISEQRVQETAFRIGDYLQRQHNITLKILCPPNISSPSRRATFSLDIGYSISNDDLIKFIKNEEDEPKTHI